MFLFVSLTPFCTRKAPESKSRGDKVPSTVTRAVEKQHVFRARAQGRDGSQVLLASVSLVVFAAVPGSASFYMRRVAPFNK